MTPPSGSFRLQPNDFTAAFGETPSHYVAARIRRYPFVYRPMESRERDACLRETLEVLWDNTVEQAGRKRHTQWEAGWDANFQKLALPFDFSSIIPGYFGKHNILRWMQTYIVPEDPHFEYSSLAIIQDWLFDKYLRDHEVVYEFGCGTGHNLFRVREVNPTADLWGLDWTQSSQEILTWLNKHGVDPRLHGHKFNLFEPDHGFALEPGAAIYTVAALEQIGRQFTPFLSYIMANRPKLCVHIEPIAELLDENHLLDYLSVRYFKHRHYLDGFLSTLRALETEGKARIHMARRTYIGSKFIDGYSVVVWSPIP